MIVSWCPLTSPKEVECYLCLPKTIVYFDSFFFFIKKNNPNATQPG